MSSTHAVGHPLRRVFTADSGASKRRATILAGLTRLYVPRGFVVRSGPFAGMRYVARASWCASGASLNSGSYPRPETPMSPEHLFIVGAIIGYVCGYIVGRLQGIATRATESRDPSLPSK